MDLNFELLLILGAVGVAVGLVTAVFSSARVREHGLFGALRRALSGGAGRSPYSI
jgi:hypothetical protein